MWKLPEQKRKKKGKRKNNKGVDKWFGIKEWEMLEANIILINRSRLHQ